MPLFVSDARLIRLKTLPQSITDWCLDSGGFTAITQRGGYSGTDRQYADRVLRYQQEIGRMKWATTRDYMCEPIALNKTGLTVEQHIQKTVESYLSLSSLEPGVKWLPVIQGFTLSEYSSCVDLYEKHGVDLSLCGLGSVCRRQATTEIHDILKMLSSRGIKPHGFGVKTLGLEMYQRLLQSSDSMAWSLAARYSPALPGCPHFTCSDCLRYATLWYNNLRVGIDARNRET